MARVVGGSGGGGGRGREGGGVGKGPQAQPPSSYSEAVVPTPAPSGDKAQLQALEASVRALRAACEACVGDPGPLKSVLEAPEQELAARRAAAKPPRAPHEAAQQALARHRKVQNEIAAKDKALAQKKEAIERLQREIQELEAERCSLQLQEAEMLRALPYPLGSQDTAAQEEQHFARI